MYRNKFLTTIKNHFDVSNTSIANLIGASIDFVKSVSAGRRTFSLKHIEPLVRLQQALSLETPVEALAHASVNLNDGARQALNTRVKKLTRTIGLKKEELKLLQEHSLVLQRGLHACHVLLLQDSLSAHDRKWVELRQRHVGNKLTGPIAQKIVLLKARIAGLEVESRALAKLKI